MLGDGSKPLTQPREDDTKWPQKNKDGRQELEIRLGSEHISFEVLRPTSTLCLKGANVDRLPKLGLCKTYKTRQIQKDFACFITSFKT